MDNTDTKQELHHRAITREQFITHRINEAEADYVKLREDRPAVRCVGYTQEGKPCEKFAIVGSNLCQYHGGYVDKSQLVGPEVSGQFKIPKRRKINIAGRLNEIRNIITEDAQNVLDSTEEIEILTARFQYLLEVSENLPVLSQKVIEEYDKWTSVRASGNKVRFAEQTARLQDAIEACRPGIQAKNEFYILTEQLRRFKETEMKRRIAMRQMMDAGDAAKLFEAVKQSIEAALAEIDDVDLRKKVKRTFRNNFRKHFFIPEGGSKQQHEELTRQGNTFHPMM